VKLALLARTLRRFHRLTPRARTEVWRDHLRGSQRNHAAPADVVAATAAWLADAQDHSASADGGFARDYSLVPGWTASYPETTGYIIPTFLALADRGAPEYQQRARRALDWLVGIQFPEGGFQGGRVNDTPRVPVTFNTGQILLGLAAGAARWPEAYLEPMHRAAVWLRDSLDPDGAWRRHSTPFAAQGDKVYETHVAWGLLEAARVAPGEGYGEAALANIAWALTHQTPNGWFSHCCLEDPTAPLTHTLGYALRGIIEGWRFSGDPALLAAAHRTARALEACLRPDGSIAGRLDADWQPAVPWVCMTGCVQISACWSLLANAPNAPATYRQSAERTLGFVRRSIDLEGPIGVRGGVKGSFPVDGEYGRLQYLNWAAKFYLDAELLVEAGR
jgi:hypothetical protein